VKNMMEQVWKIVSFTNLLALTFNAKKASWSQKLKCIEHVYNGVGIQK